MCMTRFICMCLFTHHIFIEKANIIPLSLESHIHTLVHKETDIYIYKLYYCLNLKCFQQQYLCFCYDFNTFSCYWIACLWIPIIENWYIALNMLLAYIQFMAEFWDRGRAGAIKSSWKLCVYVSKNAVAERCIARFHEWRLGLGATMLCLTERSRTIRLYNMQSAINLM